MMVAKVFSTMFIVGIGLLWLIWSILNLPTRENTPGLKSKVLTPVVVAFVMAAGSLFVSAIALLEIIWSDS